MIDLFAWPSVKAALDALDAAEAVRLQARRSYRLAAPGRRADRLEKLWAATVEAIEAGRVATQALAEAEGRA
jgi:hypothetical protein